MNRRMAERKLCRINLILLILCQSNQGLTKSYPAVIRGQLLMREDFQTAGLLGILQRLTKQQVLHHTTG